jgi:hypothetical protein
MRAERTRRISAPFRRHGWAWLVCGLLALPAEPCFAQARSTVSALPVQGLRFGVLSAGAPSIVSPADAGRRASLDLVGAGQVTVTFQLPPALRTPAGAALPLRFGPTDGRIEFPRSARVIEFDPAVPVNFTIPPGLGAARIFLGGTAQPGTRQPPGSYDGVITVQVVVANASS